jgi:hypothetical protein
VREDIKRDRIRKLKEQALVVARVEAQAKTVEEIRVVLNHLKKTRNDSKSCINKYIYQEFK